MNKQTTSNRLAEESSPYLQQHASNPVHWQPWDKQALEQARREDKPILVSIGYSACHWCHVMEHESFDDTETADLMNQYFINIKVDREERPDLDKVYQTAHQLLVQRPGGWPLNMFIAPDSHLPIFGGTYFPPEPRHGMPAFRTILQSVAEFYKTRRGELTEQYDYLSRTFERLDSQTPDTQLDATLLTKADTALANSFDRQHGGLGSAPKFFHTPSLEFCLKRSVIDDNRDAAHNLKYTLTVMANSGIFDQLAGGFFRYSVDDYWMIPHFEKMLYDNGQLLGLYAEAGSIYDNPLFKSTAIKTADWALAEMLSPEGGFYSTLDADSEGEEGKFYAWSREELQSLLNDDQWSRMVRYYELGNAPNFERHWHLHASDPANTSGNTALADIHDVLLNARAQRVRPGRDEKILTAWNALMIRGLAMAGRLLDKPEYTSTAHEAMQFVQQKLWKDNILHATCKDGVARHQAYLDDYAYTLLAALELLQAQWRDSVLEFAIKLADCLLADFEDTNLGGFYFTAHDHESLPYRPKPSFDDAMPSGNGIAALALNRLGLLLGESRYLVAAENTLKAMQPAIQNSLTGAGALLLALDDQIQPPEIIIVRGKAAAVEEWRRLLNQQHHGSRLVFAISDQANLGPLSPALAAKTVTDRTCAYLCQGMQCQPPVFDVNELTRK